VIPGEDLFVRNTIIETSWKKKHHTLGNSSYPNNYFPVFYFQI
jgi:hypothetical protein